MLDKERVKEYYIRGLNAKEIAEKLEAKPGTVQKCINRNFSKHKEVHKSNRSNYKSIVKSVDDMNRKFISDSSLLKWSRQSYDYDENYNLVFNENRGLKPYDMKKQIKTTY